MRPSKQKSRTFRRVFKRTPGARTKIFYIKRKPKNAHCSKCGEVLKGVPRLRPYKAATTAKTKKRPQRPFGGVLCSGCLRQMIKQKARSQ